MQNPSPSRPPSAPAEPSGPPRTVIVLGGTGCVGRHVCAAFARRGYRVVVVARRPAAHLADQPFRSLDLGTASPADLRALFTEEGAHAVVNATDMGGATDVTGAADGGEARAAELLDASEGLARRLVGALAGLPARPVLVHIGTIHEYGPGIPGTPLDETVPPAPSGAYARAKLAASRAVQSAADAGEISAVVLRLVNTCGPYPTPAGFVGKLLPTLRTAAETGAAPEVTVGDAVRDWIDVRDVAEAVVLAVLRPTGKGTFNIGSGVGVPVRELVSQALTVAGLPDSGVRAAPTRGLGADWIQADIGQARTQLGWAPRIPLRQSLSDMWDSKATSR
ncbi:NAD-dependent epimerase/dehydratase [Streptomyces europaeiscabiei]|uniref:NAD-dependent epimerase/dehydratase family protein n=1 Tax=Streptomyces europaeiscabiei TaxID=146819 RepID=UPI0029AD2EC4|nr:NAD-dependent epimerase/dehydratase [Streptomyces europaeiscabiei]MDX3691362.1 NAD-dependent epimerase/dehydratase [Streptomyces europaeiscabiei]